MFFGTYTPKLDEKGRLFLPAKFRDDLVEGLVVTRGQERCLTVWSNADFSSLTTRLGEASLTDFKHVCRLVHGLDGGVWINIGCAVVLPDPGLAHTRTSQPHFIPGRGAKRMNNG